MRKLTLALLALASICVFGVQRRLSAQEPKAAASPDPALAGSLPAYYTSIPWDGADQTNDATQALASASNIAHFSYSIAATKDNSTRTGIMIGTSPFVTPLTGTAISTVIVPLKVTIGLTTFDPTAPNSCDSGISAVSRFNSSPLVTSVPNLTFNGVNVGTAQYVNGFRRAEFWNTIGGSPAYQNTLSPVVTAAAVGSLPGTHGIMVSSGCSKLGIVSNSWLDGYLRLLILPSLTKSGVISPTTFVIFLLRNVAQSSANPPTSAACCILGYHSSKGLPAQTYAVVDWDTTGLFGSGVADGSAASHEVAEWMDDPLGTNATPAWGNIGQVSGCQRNLEVADPLSGTLMPGYTLGGFTFHVQELAFFNWYFNQNGVASMGAGGKFSGNGTFAGPSKACPPGGTN